MPRKRKEIHPSLLKNQPTDEDEAAVMGGHPQHGDEHPPEDEDFDDDEDEFEEDEDELERPETRAERLEREVRELKAENARIANRIPPAQVQATPEPEEEEVDWDNLIFTDPKKALDLTAERVRREVTRELRGEYQREQSTTRFWTEFYKKNDDLKADKDIVEMMLSKHMADLADVPVDKAMEKLADLTRERVMKYSNNRGGQRKRTRAVTTGASNGARPAAAKSDVKATASSLTSIIKNRRELRRSGGKPNGRLGT